MNKELSIIIPIFNETEGILILVKSLNDFIANNKDVSFELIFVDDGSLDDSFQILQKQIFENVSVQLISLSKNYGSHAALRAGISKAKKAFITFMYADLQDPLNLLIDLLKKQQEGFDIVWANRRTTNNKILDTSFSYFYAFLMRKFTFPNFPTKGFDIVLFNSKVKEQLDKNMEANSNIFLQILGMGFKQSSISYDKRERKIGKSKWTLSKKIKIIIDSFVAFSYFPVRFVSFIGIAFFLIGLAWTIYILYLKIVYDNLTSGWPTLISILLLGFGITNISLGIIAEYLWRTLDSSRKRPVFIIDDVIELNNNNNK